MKINIRKIKELVKDGYISERKHPECDYYIYNYTCKTQYEQMWTEETMMCRGLILDGQGNIIAKPFPKFFNIGEYNQHNHLGKIPHYDYFDIFNKMDGSLGILYKMPNGEFRIATRGSFESDQAKKGTEIFKVMLKDDPQDIFFDNITYLFEIIYPENRIVVDYGGKEELVLLDMIYDEDFDDEKIEYETLLRFAEEFSIPVTQYYGRVAYNRHAFLKIAEKIPEGNEGFVLKFNHGLRVKVKSEEYVRLHKLLTGVSNKSIWDLLRNGQDVDELLDRVPDEFYDWVKKTKETFESQYEDLENVCWKIIRNEISPEWDIKEVAQHFNKYRKERAVLFAMYKEKDYKEIIWKMLRPEYSKPFNEEK